MIIPATAFVFFTAITYVIHSIAVKFSSGKIDPYSGIFFWSIGALIIGICSFLYGRFVVEETNISGAGSLALLIAGALICSGSIGYLLAYQRGVDFSFAAPLVNISVVMGGLIFGYLLFKEDISMPRILGVLLGGISIFLITRS